MKLAVLCVALLIVQAVVADVYFNNGASPRSSNNRLNEQSANRDNGDRLFDSQNNNRGGYNVGEKTAATFPQDISTADSGPDKTFSIAAADMTAMQYQQVFYEGSIAMLEWTAQHACGGNEQDDPQKINCDIILQYMCNTDPTTPNTAGTPGIVDLAMQVVVRDGLNTQTPDEPNTLTEVSGNNAVRGHHESEPYYYECKRRSRNRGLFHADQNLNGQSAIYTRQDNNGNRQGLECDEERDYYPYWGPNPWRDIAYLTDTPSRCEYILANSQNQKSTWKCTAPAVADRTDAVLKPITEAECLAAEGTWTEYLGKGIPLPECKLGDWSRDNHLGNGRFGQPNTYNWTMPYAVSRTPPAPAVSSANGILALGQASNYAKCVLRLRYNISTDDYNPWSINSTADNNPQKGIVSPVQENPYVDVGADLQGLRLAINTAQFGRTFQDRSHVFYIKQRPAAFASSKIVNLGVRGKRGNIVQTYPAVEYDFAPNRLHISTEDLVHIQWTGSNTHNNGNPAGDGQAGDAGEGTGGTDRQNMVQMLNLDDNYPLPLDKFPDNMWSAARSECWNGAGTKIDPLPCALTMATSGYYRTVAEATTATTNFNPLLNDAPASLVGGMMLKWRVPAEYNYMATRNNNFSNRSQKGTIIIA